jgi:hypothetical protein
LIRNGKFDSQLEKHINFVALEVAHDIDVLVAPPDPKQLAQLAQADQDRNQNLATQLYCWQANQVAIAVRQLGGEAEGDKFNPLSGLLRCRLPALALPRLAERDDVRRIQLHEALSPADQVFESARQPGCTAEDLAAAEPFIEAARRIHDQ